MILTKKVFNISEIPMELRDSITSIKDTSIITINNKPMVVIDGKKIYCSDHGHFKSFKIGVIETIKRINHLQTLVQLSDKSIQIVT